MPVDLRRDLKTLAMFINLYCRCKHGERDRQEVELKTHNVREIAGRPIILCEECRKLLIHAYVKRTHCPMHPKPQCKHCPSHCYHPVYREKIREVMRYSGKKMLLGGRLDYLFHLLF